MYCVTINYPSHPGRNYRGLLGGGVKYIEVCRVGYWWLGKKSVFCLVPKEEMRFRGVTILSGLKYLFFVNQGCPGGGGVSCEEIQNKASFLAWPSLDPCEFMGK